MAFVDFKTIKDALAAWVEAVLVVPTHWAGQEAPRPAYPYVALDIVSGPMRVHQDAKHIVPDEDDIRIAIRGDRTITFSVEPIVSFEGVAYNHGADAFALAEELRSSLERDSIMATLTAAGLSVQDSGGAITNRRTALDAGFLSRAGFDLVTGVTASYVPATAETAIERVEAESTISDRVSDDYYGADGDPTPV